MKAEKKKIDTNSIDIILRTAEQIYLYSISTKLYNNLSLQISIVFCQ